MQNMIFRSRMVLVLIAGGILAVSAFALAGVFTTSESATDNVAPNSLASQIGNDRKKGVAYPSVTDVPEEEYKRRLTRISQLSDEFNFDDLVKEGDEIHQIWGSSGGERFARLTLALINALGRGRVVSGNLAAWGSHERHTIREKYAIAALAVRESYGIESELNLVGQLQYSAFTRPLSEAEASKLRQSSKFWLHLLARIESEKDPSVNLDPHQSLSNHLITPVELRTVEIENPLAAARLRAAEAEHQEKLKKISNQFQLQNHSEIAERIGTKFLANVYSRPPFSREELDTLLSEHAIAESLRRSILKARDDLEPRSSQ